MALPAAADRSPPPDRAEPASGEFGPPVLSIDDFVPSDATRFQNVRTLSIRYALLVFLILLAAALVIEVVRFLVGG